MAWKNIKTYYYYPLITVNGKDKILELSPILRGLSSMNPEERVLDIGEENIQLKQIHYFDETKRWELAFLKNIVDAPFKSKLDDDTDTADTLDDDEFVGHECCVIYDETTNIISIQNNRNSISYKGITNFLNEYTDSKLFLSIITYKDEYSDISDDKKIDYRSIIIGYTDISRLIEIDDDSIDDDSKKIIKSLSELSNNMCAINGKIELSVGRKGGYLKKSNLKHFVKVLKRDKDVTKNLKVKMHDGDTIRLVDLLNNKVYHECKISVTKNDPKTFKRILDAMDGAFDTAIKECFDKCSKFTNS